MTHTATATAAHTTVGLTIAETDALIALLTAARDTARTQVLDPYGNGNALPVYVHFVEGRFGGPVEVMTARTRVGESTTSWTDAHSGIDCD